MLQGAPIVTFDLDILRRRTPENGARLLRVLERLLLDTNAGDLDVLGTIEESTGYEELLDETVEIDLEGARIKVLCLERLIRAKEHAGRPKDLAVLPVLRATLEQSRKREG